MGDDQRIVNAARCSYGKDERDSQDLMTIASKIVGKEVIEIKEEFEHKVRHIDGHAVFEHTGWSNTQLRHPDGTHTYEREEADHTKTVRLIHEEFEKTKKKDKGLIRRLMRDGHTSPFEKVKFEFLVRVPMDCWRQWIRHRTADVNEYSTRYSEAIDSQQVTLPGEWRLQAKDNKQGSSGFLEEWPEGWTVQDTVVRGVNETYGIFKNDNFVYHCPKDCLPGSYLTEKEYKYHQAARELYQERLDLGIAREQARKDLPLSTYTEAYWGCSLHNIFNFLRLRMDEHAQLEIRLYANAMFDIIKQVCPISCEAFEDYILHARKFSRMEMEFLKYKLGFTMNLEKDKKPDNLTDNEWKDFLKKLS